MKPKKERSLVVPVGVALVVFVIGCAILLVGLARTSNGMMLAGALTMGAGGGMAALMGDKLSEDFVKSQGGGPAKRAREDAERAREEAEHNADSTVTDLTVPEEWQQPPKR